MRVLIATDAWHPQVNGVVRTLTSLARSGAQARRRRSSSCRPKDFVPSRCRPIRACASRCRAGGEIARRIESGERRMRSTSRPKDRSGYHGAGLLRQARTCLSPRATRRSFPEYIAARFPIPEALELRGPAPLPFRRDGHDGRRPLSLMSDAERAWLRESRHVDPRRRHRPVQAGAARIELDLPRPIFVSVGRVAVEKNLEAFLSLDLPGTKSGDRARARRRPSCARAFPTPGSSA